MESNDSSWKVGEIVLLPRTARQLKISSFTTYERIIGSRYMCIREATDSQFGILLKVLGRTPAERIMMVEGVPFCKDDSMELFEGICYFSYPFPKLKDVKEVLETLRNNPDLLPKLETASMHINPKSSFWLRETTKKFFFIEKPQCYDVSTDSLSTATDDAAPYRLTMLYFSKDQSISVR